MQPLNVDGDYKYQNNPDGTVTITGYTGADTDLIIPSELNGRAVKGIGRSSLAFKGFKSVVIPESVTEIGFASFANNELVSIEIPQSVTDIRAAFNNNNLTKVTINSKSKKFSIGKNAFEKTNQLQQNLY